MLSLNRQRLVAAPAVQRLPALTRPVRLLGWRSTRGTQLVRSLPEQNLAGRPDRPDPSTEASIASLEAVPVGGSEVQPEVKPKGRLSMAWMALGVGLLLAFAQTATGQDALSSVMGLFGHIHIHDAEKAVLEAIWLLLASCVCVPLAMAIPGGNPVLGYLAGGAILGPYGLGVTQDVHTLKHLAEMGVVFLLFNIGLELSLEKLQSMAKFVFGMGSAQVLASLAGVAAVAMAVAGLTGPSAIVLGGALAMSTTAVVIQVLNDRKELATEHGQAAFSVLLMQDLAVVVLLMLIPLLAPSPDGSSASLGAMASALGVAGMKAVLAIVGIIAAGRLIVKPVYKKISSLGNSELFLATSMLVCLGTSMLTQLAGLSLALGAFLAGLLLAETEYAHKVEHAVAPYKGLLLGLFFMTVGMEISVQLFMKEWLSIVATIVLLIGGKLAVMAAIGPMFGLSMETSIRSGLLLAPGGELAFVAFGEAVNKGVLSEPLTAQLYMAVALSMAMTPYLAAYGEKVGELLGTKPKKAIAAPAAAVTAPAEPSAGGPLGTSSSQAAAYSFLAAASVAFGATALIFPQQLLHLQLHTPDIAYARIAGATMVLSAAVELVLAKGAQAGRLAAVTYQRLQLASVAKNAAFLAAFAVSSHLWAPAAMVLPAVAAAGVAVSLITQKAATGDLTVPAFDLSLPKTTSGWMYSVFSLLYVATAAACALNPEIVQSSMTLTSELLKHMWAPGYLLAAAVCLVLKDAAERGRLGASAFRALNLGLAGFEVGYAVAVVDSTPVLSLGGSAVIAAFCVYQCLLAKGQ